MNEKKFRILKPQWNSPKKFYKVVAFVIPNLFDRSYPKTSNNFKVTTSKLQIWQPIPRNHVIYHHQISKNTIAIKDLLLTRISSFYLQWCCSYSTAKKSGNRKKNKNEKMKMRNLRLFNLQLRLHPQADRNSKLFSSCSITVLKLQLFKPLIVFSVTPGIPPYAVLGINSLMTKSSFSLTS